MTKAKGVGKASTAARKKIDETAVTTRGQSVTKGNKGGAVRGQARAAQVKARSGARKAARTTKKVARKAARRY